jgi:pyruvate formate-lyase activating enzyme-like uncharacterized protein
MFLVKKEMIKADEAILHIIQVDLIHYMSIESGQAAFTNYNELFVKAQNMMPLRTNRFEASLNPTTESTEDNQSTKRARQTSPSLAKAPPAQAPTKSSIKSSIAP